MSNASSRAWAARVNLLAASPLIRPPARRKLLMSAGITIGRHASVLAHSWIFSDQLLIGDETLVGYACHIENREPVNIGARCSIAPQVSILTSTHTIGNTKRRADSYAGAPVRIEDGCWIGARAMILPGVTIGRGCVIGAAALVTTDCEPNGLYAGLPARRRQDLICGC